MFPLKAVMPELAKMRIFKEGEGNGRKTFTCGPSASRNVIAALFKRDTGRYRDLGEHKFEVLEHTKRIGTSRANIATALSNKPFKRFGAWVTVRPSSRFDLVTRVINNVARQRRPVIMNLDTKYLARYHGHNLAHFNVVFGYRIDGRWKLRFAEEWNPVFAYGSTPSYGNPYGKFWESASAAFRAIDADPIHGIVA